MCVHQPTAGLRKLTYQWSEPVFLVLSVTPSVARAVSLVSTEGGKGLFPKTININRKMMVPFPISPSFFIGARVMRKFKQGVFSGTVSHVIEDDGNNVWHVVYDDFDSEDLSANELYDAIYYHPLLDASSDLVLPSVGEFVWYSFDRLPRLGRVVGLDPTTARPVTVRVFVPRSGAKSLPLATYKPKPQGDEDREASGCYDVLHLSQIRFGFQALTGEGKLPASARKRLRSCLRR